MSDWRDFEEGRRGFSLSQLSDGQQIELYIDESPYLNTEEIEQEDGSVETSEALRVPAIPLSVPDGFGDMSGDPVEAIGSVDDLGDDSMRYHIINSSTAFKVAMRDAFPNGIEPKGSVVTVTAHQPEGSDQYSRTYSVESDI